MPHPNHWPFPLLFLACALPAAAAWPVRLRNDAVDDYRLVRRPGLGALKSGGLRIDLGDGAFKAEEDEVILFPHGGALVLEAEEDCHLGHARFDLRPDPGTLGTKALVSVTYATPRCRSGTAAAPGVLGCLPLMGRYQTVEFVPGKGPGEYRLVDCGSTAPGGEEPWELLPSMQSPPPARPCRRLGKPADEDKSSVPDGVLGKIPAPAAPLARTAAPPSGQEERSGPD